MVSEKVWMLTSVFFFILLMFLFANQYNAQITGKPVDSDETVRVDFFAMSMCKYCVNFEPALAEVIRTLEDNVRFRVFYVAFEEEDGFRSLHGQEEVEEDMRQLCAREYYPGRFFDYLLCMGRHYSDPSGNWEQCAENSGIDPMVLRDCRNSEEGRYIFSENIKKREYLGISESPVLIINNKRYTGKRTPEALKDRICDEFENPPEACGRDLRGGGITGAIIGIPEEGSCVLE